LKKFYSRLPSGTRIKIRSLIPRNLLRRYFHARTDAYLISYPKCGRTWLRLLIGRAIVTHYILPEKEDYLFLRTYDWPRSDIPVITVVHDDRPMLKTPEELEHSKRRYHDKQVIFLVRDPRDVVVSSYYEMKKRGLMFGENPYEQRQPVFNGTLAEFIDRREGGFETILEFYRIWANSREIPAGFLLVRYEDLKLNAEGELRRILDFLGLKEISSATIAEAVNYASFENMRKMEQAGKFSSGALKPGDKDDPESFKTRKGKVGGYKEALSAGEIARLNEKMALKLPDFYGYLQKESAHG
jgi:hypothetical protein